MSVLRFHIHSFGFLGLSMSLTAWSEEPDKHSESTEATEPIYILWSAAFFCLFVRFNKLFTLQGLTAAQSQCDPLTQYAKQGECCIMCGPGMCQSKKSFTMTYILIHSSLGLIGEQDTSGSLQLLSMLNEE